jgi:hypothetical protein
LENDDSSTAVRVGGDSFWTAVAERERRHRFRACRDFAKKKMIWARKRHGAALPAAVQDAARIAEIIAHATRFEMCKS